MPPTAALAEAQHWKLQVPGMHVDDHQAKHGRSAASRTYALGHTTDEFKRLERQDMYYRELTETFLLRAGLAPGGPDIGGGGGGVALMAARLGGPSGSVLGTDRSAAAVALATRRAAEAGESGVKFSVCELDALPTRPLFNAVIGRFILMYLPNPAGLLKRVCRCLRPGGIVAFQEHVMQLSRSVPELPPAGNAPNGS